MELGDKVGGGEVKEAAGGGGNEPGSGVETCRQWGIN